MGLVTRALRDMRLEIVSSKKYAEEFLSDVKDMSPEDMSAEDTSAGESEAAPVDDITENEGNVSEKAPEIKNVNDAKKYLNEAKTDLQAVIDNLDGLLGQADEEIEGADYKRSSASYKKGLQAVARTADSAIKEARDAVTYWSFLKKYHNPATSIQNVSLAAAAATVQEVSKFSNLMKKLFGAQKKEATAVPPTGAKFTGDKWPGGKNTAEVEERAWHAGANKFNSDKSFEDARPNAAAEHRLDPEDYSRNDKPYVNATFHMVPNNKFASHWDVFDSKSNKILKVAFANLPDNIGERNGNTFSIFKNKFYGGEIVSSIIREGVEAVRKELNGNYKSASLNAIASMERYSSDPNIKDKASVRKYYTEMYGDAAYARELTSSDSNSRQGSASNEHMNVGYTPKDEHPESRNTDHVKDGPGKLSAINRNHRKNAEANKDPRVIKAKVRRSIEVARKFAATGAIPFTKKALLEKSRELMTMSSEQFLAIDSTISQIAVVNNAALVEAHIPDTENGIVGDTATGVTDPRSTVDTEGINNVVDKDAKISSMSKSASIVPQMSNGSPKAFSIANSFNTVSNRLQRKGVNPQNVLRKPKYLGR